LAKNGNIRDLVQLAQELREKHVLLKSWRKAAVACNVLTADGRADPSLAQRIAERGYNPKRHGTRTRLGLPPVCVNCGQKVRRVRQVPAWLEEAVGNLRKLEEKADDGRLTMDDKRVYSRQGKRANITDEIPVFDLFFRSPLLNMCMCVCACVSVCVWR
jgi:hypothetical protein